MPMAHAVHEPTPNREQAMLLDFLSEHDASCPVCGYGLKGLTRPVCPECRHDLVLGVGVPRLGIAWLLVALAPGFFCGFASWFLLIPTIGIYLDDGVFFPPFVGGVLFAWCSGLLRAAGVEAPAFPRSLGVAAAAVRAGGLGGQRPGVPGRARAAYLTLTIPGSWFILCLVKPAAPAA